MWCPAIFTVLPDEDLEGSEVKGTGSPGALAQLRDLMVCGAGGPASLGLHGNAAVAARNRRSTL
jgi:hypothetical protein